MGKPKKDRGPATYGKNLGPATTNNSRGHSGALTVVNKELSKLQTDCLR